MVRVWHFAQAVGSNFLMPSSVVTPISSSPMWRLKILNRITLIVLGLGCVWVLGFSWGSPFAWSTRTLVLPLVAAAYRRFPYSIRAHFIAVSLLYVSGFAAATTGASPGAFMAGLMAIVSAGLFLGIRGTVAYWLLSSLSLVLGFWLLRQEPFGLTHDATWMDVRQPSVVFRYVFTYAVLSCCLTFAVIFVVRRLSLALERTEEALRVAEDATIQARDEAAAKESALLGLVEAQKFEVLAQLAASVAHDFNNSLQVIMANATVLHSSVEPGSELNECAQEVLDMCNESSQVARQLLTLGERVVLERSSIDVGREVQSVQRAVRRLLPCNIEVECHAPGGLVAFIDRVQFKQALLNLAINAQHAMPDGGRLCIEVGSLRDNQVGVRVSDTGAGMDEDTLRHVFEPFFSTKGAKGSGLGLATVRAVMHQHEGTVQVQSEPGRGTSFLLSFPAVEEPHFETSETTIATFNLKGRIVLVVDDDARVRRVIVGMLQSAGAVALGVENGGEAIRLMEKRGYDLSLLCTDAVMPGMPTRELIAHMQLRAPHAGVLVCSAYVENELLRRGIEMQQVAYLAKPFSAEMLLSKVSKILKAVDRSSRTG